MTYRAVYEVYKKVSCLACLKHAASIAFVVLTEYMFKNPQICFFYKSLWLECFSGSLVVPITTS